MNLEAIFREIQRFVQTKEYLNGLIVALSGIVIEVIFLIIAIPIFLKIIGRIQTRQIRAQADFYLVQIFHRMIHMLLVMGGIDDVTPILRAAQMRNPRLKMTNKLVYRDLEKMLFAFKRVFIEPKREGKFMMEIEKRKVHDFQRYTDTCYKCIEEIDRLAAIYINVPTVRKVLFNVRLLLYPIYESMYRVTSDTRPRSSDTGALRFPDSLAFELFVRTLVKNIDKILIKRKRLIDSVIRSKIFSRKLKFFLLLPYKFLKLRISTWICRLRGKPYEGTKYGNIMFRHYLLGWRLKNRFTMEQAAKALGMSTKEYRDYEYHYREPRAKWESIKKHLRGEVDYSEIKKENKSID